MKTHAFYQRWGLFLSVVLFALPGLLAGASCVNVPSGLVSWWAGEATADDVLGANPGVLTNGAGFAIGEVGSGFSFTNSNSRVDTGTHGMNVGTNDFTVEGWERTSATKTWNTLVSFDSYRPALYIIGNGSLQLYPASQSPAAGLNDGQFHHFAAVRQNGVVTYYKDGTAIGTANYADALAPQQFHIGDDLYGGDQFAGVIDEVAFYQRALSANEVQSIFAAGSAGKCPPSSNGGSTYTLSRIEVNRTFGATWLAATSTRPLQETNGPGQQTFELGWNFKWPDPTGPNWNIATSIVTLALAPAVVTPGGSATFVATMTGHWDTTGYAIDRDHTISLVGVAGTSQFSNVGDPSSVQDGQFGTTNTVTVPAASGSEIALTLNAGLRFGSDHTGAMVIKLVYAVAAPGGEPKLALSMTNLNFGSVSVGQNADIVFLVTNLGTSVLTISSNALNNSAFTVVSPAWPVSVFAGGILQVRVRFAPAGAGNQSGTLTLTSDDPSSPSAAIALSGQGADSGNGTYQLSRIEVNRTFGATWLAATSTRPLQETNGPGQQTFELGWNFKWPDPTGPNWNIATSIVTLAQAPAVVTPGGSATFVATMTGHWDTMGYGIDRDHTISLVGVAGTSQFSNVGDPSSVQDGQFGTTNTVTVPAASGSEIALTLNAGLRFGNDHTGGMTITLVYSSVAVTNQPITKLARLDLRSADDANWEVSWASSAQVYHLETTDSLTPPVQWSPLNLVSTPSAGREIVHVPKQAKAGLYIRARAEGTVLSAPTYVAGVRSLSAIAALDGSGTLADFQAQICTNLQDSQDSFAAWGAALDGIGAQADAALAGALQGTGLQGYSASRSPGGVLRRMQPQDSGYVPGPLTDIINQFKQVKQTVDDLKKDKAKLDMGLEILSWITQNKSFDEIVSSHSSFFSQISGIFKQMREDVEVPLGEIIDGKNAGKTDDVTDFNDLVAFVSSNDVHLAESMRTTNFSLADYQNLPLTDKQRDLVAQAFRTSTTRGRLYLRDNLMPFLKTLASAGVETYADAIFDATGAKKGANVFKSTLEYGQKIYAFLSDNSAAAPNLLQFDCRRRFLRTDDPESDVKADLFLVAKLADGSTRLATFLVSGKNVISEGGDLLLTQGLPVPALVYDILVMPRDQLDAPIKLLPLATEVDARLFSRVDLPLVSGTKLTVRPDPMARDTNGVLQSTTLSLDQIQDFDVRVDGFPLTVDGPMRGLYSATTRPDGSTSPSFLVPFLPPNLPLTLSITNTNIEAFSQSITISQAEQEMTAPVVVLPPPASTNSDFWTKVSWQLQDAGYAVVASGTGSVFSVSITNSVYVAGGNRTNLVVNISASIAASPINYGQPFDVTCTVGGTTQGSAPATVSLWISADNITELPDTPLPVNLSLKAAFRPLSTTSDNLYKADFVGSIPFYRHGTNTFLSADVPGQGFVGPFYLELAQGAICMSNGMMCFTSDINCGDQTLYLPQPSYTLHATVRAWPTGMP